LCGRGQLILHNLTAVRNPDYAVMCAVVPGVIIFPSLLTNFLLNVNFLDAERSWLAADS
jgi:hypothetical protein